MNRTTSPPAASLALAKLVGLVGLLLLGACGSGIDSGGLPNAVRRREASVVIDGCAVDPWQRATLEQPATKATVAEVILLCLSPRDNGVAPTDADARAALVAEVGRLRTAGYQVSLGLAAQHDFGPDYSPARLGAILADPARRTALVTALNEATQSANAIDLALPQLDNRSANDLTAFVSELSALARRGGRRLGLFAPPSSMSPSDLPGGDAYDLKALGGLVDRVRLMTLDYSSDVPGPTTDPDWILQVAELARGKTSAALSVALPLYGVDFGLDGNRQVSYTEAVGRAGHYQVQIVRAPASATGTLTFTYSGGDGRHAVFFDDARSLLGLQAALDAGGLDAGLVYYGLGGEDPALFPLAAERSR